MQNQSLRERQQQRQKADGKTSSGSGQSTAFHHPIHGTVDGEPVRIIASGDLAGYSPAYLCVDKTGDSVWVPMESVRINDLNFLPNPLQSQQQNQQETTGAGSSRR